MKLLPLCLAIEIGCCSLLASAASHAQSREVIDAGVQQTLRQFNQLDSRHVGLENRAAGILIFPQVTKGGVAIAAEYGEGVLQVNGATVGYYSLASASVGLTAGMASRSEIILFMTQEALNHFMKSPKWSIGAGTGIALISKGAGRDYDTNTLKKPVLGFIFGEKGLMADLSLEGSKINKINK
jgi:lipid-binding SYLF domain-containing protein